jgi:hypothetical protein
MMPGKQGVGGLVVAALAALLLANLAHAHPLGNNTVNRAAAIEVRPQQVSVRYLLDLAEIPTLLAAQEADTDGDGSASAGEWEAYAERSGKEIRAGIELSADGMPLALALGPSRWHLVPGAAGLDTLRIEAQLRASLPSAAVARIEYRDRRRTDEPGWKEVQAGADGGLHLAGADVPTVSPSRLLSAYPPAEQGVPNVLAARIDLQAATALSTPAPAAGPAETSAHSLPLAATALSPAHAGPAADAAPAQPRAAEPAALAALPPRTEVPVQRQPGAFFRLGVHHIATGWDHLVFLLGLIVAQKSLRRLAWVITAFTLAHSLTLGLAASGLVRPPGEWVEPAIALTIAYVGLANLTGRLHHGASVAFAFGLIHGLGFAGALAQSLQAAQTGGSGWLLELAAFNLGIEAFQLALVLLLVPLMRLGARLSWSLVARQAASLGVLAAGLGWFIVRLS